MIESYEADGRQNQPEVFWLLLLRILAWVGKIQRPCRRDLCYLDKHVKRMELDLNSF